MKKLLFVFVVLGISLQSFAAPKEKDFIGTWKYKVETDEGTLTGTMKIEKKEGKLVGEVKDFKNPVGLLLLVTGFSNGGIAYYWIGPEGNTQDVGQRQVEENHP